MPFASAYLEDARDANRQVFVRSNGGSAATGTHFTCDARRPRVVHAGAASQALTTACRS